VEFDEIIHFDFIKDEFSINDFIPDNCILLINLFFNKYLYNIRKLINLFFKNHLIETVKMNNLYIFINGSSTIINKETNSR